MSASYEQHKLLENLLGKDSLNKLPRDYDPSKRAKQLTDPSVLDSIRVCKSFLVGKCPHDLLENTKENIGECPKIHLEKYKILYESAKTKGITMPRENYELDYLKDLENCVIDCDRRIRLAERRLEYTVEEKQNLNDITRDMDELDTKVGLTNQEIENLLEIGEIEKSVKISINLKKYLIEKESLNQTYSSLLENLNQSAQQKLQVCDVCGAYLSKLDNDRRLADHFVGKIHLAYVEMRNIVKELKQKYGLQTK